MPKKTTADLFSILSSKLNATDPHYVFNAQKLPNGTYTYKLNGQDIPLNQLENLGSEARIVKEMQLYRIIRETLTKDAQNRMFLASENFEHILTGKMMLYNLSIIEKIIESLSQALLTIPKKTPVVTSKPKSV